MITLTKDEKRMVFQLEGCHRYDAIQEIAVLCQYTRDYDKKTILFSSLVNVIIYFLQSGLIACKYHIAAYFCSPESLSSGKNFSRMSILSLDVYPHRIELSASIASRLLR